MRTNKLAAIFVAVFFSLSANAQSVDPLTGRLNYSVVLHTLSVSDIAIPIGIANSGGSMRVQEPESDGGLGWSQLGGGAVIRRMKGLPDDYNQANDLRKGWLQNGNGSSIQNFAASADDNLAICSDESADWTFLADRNYIKDTEPDVFSFYAPGLSGEFVFDVSGTPRLLTQQNIAISVNRDVTYGWILSFTIKGTNGLIYTFANDQWTETKSERWKSVSVSDTLLYQNNFERFRKTLSYRTAWHLTSIQSSLTGTTANYAYTIGDETFGSTFYTKIEPSTSTQVDTLFLLSEKISPSRLSAITINQLTANFNRTDNLIQSITINDNLNNDSREFRFLYTFFTFQNDAYPSRHLPFLREIRQVDNCIPLAAYTFSYTGLNFNNRLANAPWQRGWGQDWFGYFNGATSNRNVSTLYYYAGESNARRIRLTPIVGLTPTQTLPGQDRNVNASFVGFGALTEILTPMGGKTTVEYEPNRYFDSSTNEEMLGPGVRVKKITTEGGEAALGRSNTQTDVWRKITHDYIYTLNGSATSSGKLSYPPVFALPQGNKILRSQNSQAEENSIVLYSTFSDVTIGNGRVMFEYILPGMYPLVVESDWYTPNSKIARDPTISPCVNSDVIKNGAYTYPYAPALNYDFARGLLSKRSEFRQDGSLIRDVAYTYTRLTFNAITIKALRTERHGSIYHYSFYPLLTGNMSAVAQEVTRQSNELNPSLLQQTTATFTYNPNRLLENLTQNNPDNSVVRERFRYASDFAITSPAVNDHPAIAIKALVDNGQVTQLIEKINYYTPPGGTESVSKASLSLFKLTTDGKPMPQQVRSLLTGAALTLASATASNFVFDADYRLLETYDDYDASSNLLTKTSQDARKSAFHYYAPFQTIAATFSDCSADHALFESFEANTGRGLTSAGANEPGWTGERSRTITSATPLLSQRNLLKGQNSYRFSCWISAAQTTDLRVKLMNGSTELQTVTISYVANEVGKWVYKEILLNTTSVPASFGLRIESTASALIDDIVLLPTLARVSFGTSRPLFGATSQTDDLGNSNKFLFDKQGRVTHVLDRQRNLVQVNEYKFAQEPSPAVVASFTSSINEYTAGQSATFTAATNCFPVTHQWKVNGVAAGSSSSLTFTFGTAGAYSVELTVTNGTYGSRTYAETICVELNLGLTVSVPGPNPFDCPDAAKTFTAETELAGCQHEYTWYLKLESTGIWTRLTTQFSNNTKTITYTGLTNYTMKVVVKSTCNNLVEYPCTGASTVTREQSVQMIYAPTGGPC